MKPKQFYTSVRVLFNRADTNHDRRITIDEFRALYLKVHPKTKFKTASDKRWRQVFAIYD